MKATLVLLEIVLPVLYGVLLAFFGRIFFRSGDADRQMRRAAPFAYIVVAIHALYIGLYTIEAGHCLLSTVYELCSLIAFTIFTVYTFVELGPSKETSGTGFFVALVAFGLQTVSSLWINHDTIPEPSAILRNPIFNAHVTTSVFGYVAFMLAAIYGGLYLLLFRAIKQNRYGPIFQHVPSLERLERFGIRATTVGFFFLTFAIILGVILIPHYAPADRVEHVLLDPKILTSLLIWIVFGATLLVRTTIHLEGRRLVLFWMSGFALTIVSMTVVNAFGTAFHHFL